VSRYMDNAEGVDIKEARRVVRELVRLKMLSTLNAFELGREWFIQSRPLSGIVYSHTLLIFIWRDGW